MGKKLQNTQSQKYNENYKIKEIKKPALKTDVNLLLETSKYNLHFRNRTSKETS